jgi:uncharacterized repeat protein (TIGR01451 family)
VKYQWYFLSNAIANATNSSYVVSNAQLTNAGTYFVALNNAIGIVNSSNAALTVYASTHTAIWTGSGANNNWSAGPNWLANTVPPNNGTTNILIAGSTRPTPNVDANWSVAGLAFDSSAGAFTLVGNPLTIGTNGITNFSVSTQTISNNLVLASSATICASNGNLNLAGSVANAGNLTIFSGAGNITNSGGISGGGTVVMNGSGTLVLSGVNGMSGGLAINSGIVQLGGNNLLAHALPISLGGGKFACAGYNATAGAVTLAANSVIDLGGANSVLQFANSSGVSWTTGATLLITNWNGSYSGGGAEQLFVGNGINCLTAGQLAQIGFAGANGIQPARLLATGEVVPVSADIATTVSSPVTVNVASNLTYTVTVTNLGPSPAANVVVRDNLPTGVTFVSATGGGTNAGGVVNWTIPSLANGAATNFMVTIAALTGTLTNTASSTAYTFDPNPANNNGSATNGQVVTTVVVSPALAGANCAQIAASNTLTWSQTVTNGKNRMLLVGINLRQKSLVVSSVTYGGVALTNLVSSRIQNAVEIWGLVAPPAGTANIVVNWTGNTDMNGWSGVFTNVNQSSPVGATAGNGAGPGTPVSVTVNANPGDLVVDSLSTLGNSMPLIPGAGQTVICSEAIGSANPNGAGAGSYKSGTGSTTMSWTAGGIAGSWDLAAVVLQAAPAPPQADVVTSVAGPASVSAATNFSYTILVTNQGPSTASNVVVSDSLPTGVAFVGASGGGTNNSGVVTWPALASLASGAGTNFTVNVTAPISGTLTNSVLSTALTGDPNPANNNGSAASAWVVTTVTAVAPTITTPPQSQTLSAGQTACFNVVATGTGPLSYQWSFGGTNLIGATNASLTLTNARLTQTGSYSVVVTNSAGTAAMAATLNVTNPVIVASFTGGTSTGMTPQGFGFQLSVPVGCTYVVLASCDMLNWIPIATNVAASATEVFVDGSSSNCPAKYYRAMIPQ